MHPLVWMLIGAAAGAGVTTFVGIGYPISIKMTEASMIDIDGIIFLNSCIGAIAFGLASIYLDRRTYW